MKQEIVKHREGPIHGGPFQSDLLFTACVKNMPATSSGIRIAHRAAPETMMNGWRKTTD